MKNFGKTFNFSFRQKFWLAISMLLIVAVAIVGSTIIQRINPYFLVMPGLIVCTILLFLQYKELKNCKVFIAWAILSVIMLVEYFWLKNFHIVLPAGNNAVNSLKSPAAFLLLFAIFKKFDRFEDLPEYIPPYKGNSGYTGNEYFENGSIDTFDRNTLTDIISFFSYFMIIGFTTVY